MISINYVVHKFGGEITKDKANLELIPDLIKQEDVNPIVVFSAIRGVTDVLANIVAESFSHSQAKELIVELRSKHEIFFDRSYNDVKMFKAKFEKVLSQLESILNGIIFQRQTPKVAQDLVLSFGERILSPIIELYLKNSSYNPGILSPEDFLIIEGESTIDLEKSQSKFNLIIDKYHDNDCLIVPGYYGIGNDGQIKLLGRSGTDYSATAISNITNAGRVVIWKSVSGFMTADPKLVSNARIVTNLTYTEVSELAGFGANVMHDQSIFPAKIKAIPIEISQFGSNKFSTVISDKSTRLGIKSITSQSNLLHLSISNVSSRSGDKGIAKLLDSVLKEKLKIKFLNTQISHSEIILAKENEIPLINFLESEGIMRTQIETEENLGLITLIGEDIMNQSFKISSLTTYFGDKKIDVVKFVTNKHSILIVVHQDYINSVVSDLHGLIFD